MVLTVFEKYSEEDTILSMLGKIKNFSSLWTDLFETFGC